MQNKTYLKIFKFFAVSLVFACSMSAFAMENGNSSYPNGSEDFLAKLNDEGLNIINYLSYRHNTDSYDNSGNKKDMKFDSKAIVDTFRIIYNTGLKPFGGSLGVHMLIPVVDLELKTPGGNDDASGVADVVIGVNEAFHSKNRHIIVGIDVTTPTGDYNKNDIANLGKNHYTIEPYALTHYITDTGFEIGAKFMYDYNTENNDTDYKSGQEFHIDYIMGQHFGPYNVGLGGYLYKQITDDKQNGSEIEDYRAQAAGIGPVFKYDYKSASFTVKYVKDFAVENTSGGDQYWFKINYAF